MAKYEIDLIDGRTIQVEAGSAREAYEKRQLLNANLQDTTMQDLSEQVAAPSVSSGEAFMLGAGRESDKLISGVQDLYYGATGNEAAQESLAARQRTNDDVFQNVQDQAPIAAALGGVLPYLAVPTARALPTVAAAGGMGAARYGDDRMMQGAMDATLAAAPFGVGRAYNAIRPNLIDPGVGAGMVGRADKLGYPLSPGDRTGLKALKVLESAIDSTPMPLNPMHRMGTQRQKMMNRASAQAIGEGGDTVTDEALGSAAARIKEIFESLKLERGIPVNEEFAGRLVDIQDSSKARLFVDNEISDTVNKVFDAIDRYGYLSPADYQSMTSQLKGKIDQVFRGKAHSIDPDYGKALGEIVEVLDDLAESAMSGEALKQMRRARAQWKALKAVEHGARESGDVSGPLVANYLRRTDKGGYLRGRNRSPLYETARMSKAFPARPDSGTAGRLSLSPQGMMSLAMSPLTSTAANAYMYGGSALSKLGSAIPERAPMLGAAPLTGRALGGMEEEERVPYLYPRTP
jgi:hypothetical protein